MPLHFYTSTSGAVTSPETYTSKERPYVALQSWRWTSGRSVFIYVFLTHALLTSPSSCARASHMYLSLLDNQPASAHSPGTMPSLSEGVARPSPSDKLPIEDLLENPDQSLDPSPKDLNPRVLRRRLGRQFDEEFLSIDKPDVTNGSFVYKLKSGRPDEARPAYLRYLRTFRMANGMRVRLKSGRKQRRRLQKLVWSFTYCPVEFSWKDLGLRFWPRWLREGECWNGRPCSMPPGMTCRPSNSVTKTLLRWHCQSRPRSRRRRPQCRWIPVQYPIITKCSCAC
ncbi:noggin-2-like [Littorina saxatilis]|uniref:Noggin n=1 Tax=Littorina saxatilis TaxID=31220 RepID=A0AAN9BW90_9CAEN